jgi:hypothetical protein
MSSVDCASGENKPTLFYHIMQDDHWMNNFVKTETLRGLLRELYDA